MSWPNLNLTAINICTNYFLHQGLPKPWHEQIFIYLFGCKLLKSMTWLTIFFIRVSQSHDMKKYLSIYLDVSSWKAWHDFFIMSSRPWFCVHWVLNNIDKNSWVLHACLLCVMLKVGLFFSLSLLLEVRSGILYHY